MVTTIDVIPDHSEVQAPLASGAAALRWRANAILPGAPRHRCASLLCPHPPLYSSSVDLGSVLLAPVQTMFLAEIMSGTAQEATQTGIGLGSALAVVCSWQRNRSILWAAIAGFCSWFYVFYFALTRRPDESR